MRTITLSNGNTVDVDYLSCALTTGLVHPDGGVIVESEFFHAHQDVAYPIEGLVIVASKKHITCLDELTDIERVDYINLVAKIRRAQRDILGINYVYYFYNEDTTHHFHTWMVPRYEWMYKFGNSIESVRPVLIHSRKSMNSKGNQLKVLQAIDALREELKG